MRVTFDKETLERFEGSDNIIPSPAYASIDYAIYIPFHKSETELMAIRHFFMFILEHYDEIHAHIRRHLRYMTYRVGFGDQNLVKFINEDLEADILESQRFLKAFNRELKAYKALKG